MPLVVTGATGHLGRLAVDHLIARGTPAADIVATGRDAAKLAALEGLGVRTAIASFEDPEALDDAFAGAEAVLLVSGSEVGKRAAQHQTVIEAVQRAGARIVYTSAPRATDSPLILAPEHKATEEAITASGLHSTIVRNGWYTENYLAEIRQLAETGTYATSVGQGRIASAERTDYAEGAAVVLASDAYVGRIFEFSGDVAWTWDELAAIVSDVTGKPASIEHITPEQHREALLAAGLDEGTVGFIVTLSQNIADGLVEAADGSLAALIGHPTAPLATTVTAVLTD